MGRRVPRDRGAGLLGDGLRSAGAGGLAAPSGCRIDFAAPRRTRRVGFVAGILAIVLAARGGAQQPADSSRRWTSSVRTAVIASTLAFSAAAAFDAKLERYAVAHRTPSLDRLAAAVDPLGRARYIVPALAGSYVLARLARRRTLSHAVLRIAAAYAAADAIESVLKPVVGRDRPSAGGPWTFHPLAGRDEWHSFPSAHTVHATALAAGIARETHQPWVTAVGLGAAAIVGAQRVYTGAHWPSDVVAGGIIGIAAGRAAMRLLRRESR